VPLAASSLAPPAANSCPWRDPKPVLIMTVTSNHQADQTLSKKRVSLTSNPAGSRVIEAESERGPDAYSYMVVGLGMVALSGMIMGFLIRWLM
jgi:hypothetical protein